MINYMRKQASYPLKSYIFCGSFISLGVFVLQLLLANIATAEAPGIVVKEVLVGSLGKKTGAFGGLTNRELNKKEDPLAYATAGYPQDFTVDSAGNIVIADGVNNRIQIFSKEGKFISIVSKCNGDKLRYPYRVTVNSADDIIVGEETNGRICLLSKTGKYLRKIDFSTIGINYSLNAIKVDNNDFIYVHQYPGKIRIFSNDGLLIDTLESDPIGIDAKGKLWSTSKIESVTNVQYITPVGNWQYIELVGIDEYQQFYFSANRKDATEGDYLLVTDSQGRIITSLKSTLNGYEIFRWHITKDGAIYAMGINQNSSKYFLKIFRIIIDYKKIKVIK